LWTADTLLGVAHNFQLKTIDVVVPTSSPSLGLLLHLRYMVEATYLEARSRKYFVLRALEDCNYVNMLEVVAAVLFLLFGTKYVPIWVILDQ
jgi:hypothetical protein